MKRKKHVVIKNKLGSYILLGVISLFSGFVFHFGITKFAFMQSDLLDRSMSMGNLMYDTSISLEERKSGQKIIDRCQFQQNAEQCFANEFGRLTEQTSIDHAIKAMQAAQTINETVRGCHLISHAISIAETRKDPTKWQDIIGIVPSDACTGGFLHGVIEAYMAYDKEFKISSQTIPEICAIVDEKTGYIGKHLDCSHIMGHLVMVETGGFVEPAITVCDNIPEELKYECFSGIFMENETRENLVSHKIKDRLIWNENTTKEQEQLCRKYDDTAGKACWREISHMFAFLSKDDPTKLYEYCSSAPDKIFQDDCYLHGIAVVGIAYRLDSERLSLFCSPYHKNDALFSECISVTVNSMIISSPEYTERSITFCKLLPDGYSGECFDEVIERLHHLVNDHSKRERYCATMPKEYKEYCILG